MQRTNLNRCFFLLVKAAASCAICAPGQPSLAGKQILGGVAGVLRDYILRDQGGERSKPLFPGSSTAMPDRKTQ